MHPYRTHSCGDLRIHHAGSTVRLAGWVFRKRDHGSLLFIDLRDQFGLTQVVVQPDSPHFPTARQIRPETVISVTGYVEPRDADCVNESIPTGGVEVVAHEISILGEAQPLPFVLDGEYEAPEELRLRYRFLDLRRDSIKQNVLLRSKIIASLRRRMTALGFNEFQTPILTCSSPEGARDYLVPSRVHPGMFYALPQAPQLFKQLLMVAGFDRYFQIAPCFRDEDARADRSPGEFYQLDMEMSFVTQDDVFAVMENVLPGVFEEFSTHRVDGAPFVRIPYDVAMLKYGTDKPDLRNPIEMSDATPVFRGSGFSAFAGAIDNGSVVRAIPVRKVADYPRSFFDKMIEYVKGIGGKGLGYIVWSESEMKGPLVKHLDAGRLAALRDLADMKPGDAMFFVCDAPGEAARIAGDVRTKLGRDLEIIEQGVFRFCWVIDFPMFERDPETGAIDFCHNPFSMPQGGLEALNERNPLDIKAFQYDIVCNGIELSSGAIRNHRPDIMYRAFEIAGYSRDEVEQRFSFMLNAFRFGAPPHGGLAPGVDRIVMLIAGASNIREVIAFPMNQRAQDLMMNAPSRVSQRQLKELHLKIELPPS